MAGQGGDGIESQPFLRRVRASGGGAEAGGKGEGSEGTPIGAAAKAKGGGEEGEAVPRCLRLKTTGDGREYVVNLTEAEEGGGPMNVAQLKRSVAKVIGAEGKYLRLIAAGKMLAPDDRCLSSFKLAENAFVHCVVSATPPRQQQAQHRPSVLANAQEAEDEDSDEEAPGRRRGFARLRDQGMSRGEVMALRAYFSAAVALYMESAAFEETEGEEAMERLWRGEEEWMDGQGELSEFYVNTLRTRGAQATRQQQQQQASRSRLAAAGLLPFVITPGEESDGVGASVGPLAGFDESDGGGTTRDFVVGFVMGFLLGFIMLFWILEGTIPHKQKLGVLAGVTCKMSLSFLQTPLDGGGGGVDDEGEDSGAAAADDAAGGEEDKLMPS